MLPQTIVSVACYTVDVKCQHLYIFFWSLLDVFVLFLIFVLPYSEIKLYIYIYISISVYGQVLDYVHSVNYIALNALVSVYNTDMDNK